MDLTWETRNDPDCMPAKPAVSVCSFLRESQESEEKGCLLGNGLFGDG